MDYLRLGVLLAWRDEIDQSDAQRLLEELLKEQVSGSLHLIKTASEICPSLL